MDPRAPDANRVFQSVRFNFTAMRRDPHSIRRALRRWFQENARKLPWRGTRDPYRIWLSEVMLQQTRVAAVLPYYRKFLKRFPNVKSLAAAPEQEVLAWWAGLGYYSRARKLRDAARAILAAGGRFPRDYDSIRKLPGVGDYTAAAMASIAFSLPHAVLDGNVARVLTRIAGAPLTRKQLLEEAQRLLDPHDPGAHNQALMELGATVCLPRNPECGVCPLASHCEAFQHGRQQELPVRPSKAEIRRIERTLLIIRGRGSVLMRQRPASDSRLAGFWELPRLEQLPVADAGENLGSFRHAITAHLYTFNVRLARVHRPPREFLRIQTSRLRRIPLSTATRKALRLAGYEV